jgi:hypothetical protein
VLHIVAVFVYSAVKGADMVMGVITYLVTFTENSLIEFGVFANVVADHEEGGVDIKLLKRVENKRGGLGDWTVVEGEVNSLLMTVHSP